MGFRWKIEERRRFKGWFLVPNLPAYESAEDAYLLLMRLESESPRRILRITPVRNQN